MYEFGNQKLAPPQSYLLQHLPGPHEFPVQQSNDLLQFGVCLPGIRGCSFACGQHYALLSGHVATEGTSGTPTGLTAAHFRKVPTATHLGKNIEMCN